MKKTLLLMLICTSVFSVMDEDNLDKMIKSMPDTIAAFDSNFFVRKDELVDDKDNSSKKTWIFRSFFSGNKKDYNPAEKAEKTECNNHEDQEAQKKAIADEIEWIVNSDMLTYEEVLSGKLKKADSEIEGFTSCGEVEGAIIYKYNRLTDNKDENAQTKPLFYTAYKNGNFYYSSGDCFFHNNGKIIFARRALSLIAKKNNTQRLDEAIADEAEKVFANSINYYPRQVAYIQGFKQNIDENTLPDFTLFDRPFMIDELINTCKQNLETIKKAEKEKNNITRPECKKDLEIYLYNLERAKKDEKLTSKDCHAAPLTWRESIFGASKANKNDGKKVEELSDDDIELSQLNSSQPNVTKKNNHEVNWDELKKKLGNDQEREFVLAEIVKAGGEALQDNFELRRDQIEKWLEDAHRAAHNAADENEDITVQGHKFRRSALLAMVKAGIKAVDHNFKLRNEKREARNEKREPRSTHIVADVRFCCC